MDNTQPTVNSIVRAYMTAVGGKQISIRRFVKKMNKPLEAKGINGFTHQTVHNWVEGKHNPGIRSLTTLKSVSGEEMWQYKFAHDLLNLLKS